MFMKFLSFLFSGVLFATPITFVSGDGIKEFNTATGTNVVLTPHSVWAQVPGARWISHINTGSGGTFLANDWNTPTAWFTEWFFLEPGSYVGTVSVWADDTAHVFFNNVQIGWPAPGQGSACASSPPGCVQGMHAVYNFTPVAGTNTLTFGVFQRDGNVSGLMYSGHVQDNPIPEPGTAFLIGAGIGLVAVGRFRGKRLC